MTVYCHLIITIVILSRKYRTLNVNMCLSSKAYLVYQFVEGCYMLQPRNTYYIFVFSRGRKGDNWRISFSLVVYYHPDCSHCYSEVVEPEEPHIVIPGLSLHDPEVTTANRKFQMKRKHVATIREIHNYI
jgi:hypothetical protein